MPDAVKKYQTVPQEVEVVQYTEETQAEVLDWLKNNGANVSNRVSFIQFSVSGEGWVNVQEGEYIVLPSDGKFYVVADLDGQVEEATSKATPARKTTVKKGS